MSQATASIRARLSRAVLLGSVACALAVSLAVWLAAQEEVDELLDDTLHASSEVLSALLPASGSGAVVGNGGLGERFVWQVVDATQHVVSRSARAPGEPLSATPLAGFFDTPRWRVFGAALGSDGRILYVAQTRAERSEAQFEVALNSVLAALAVSLLGTFWLRAHLRHELAPLQRLSERLATHEPLASGATLGAAERTEFSATSNCASERSARVCAT